MVANTRAPRNSFLPTVELRSLSIGGDSLHKISHQVGAPACVAVGEIPAIAKAQLHAVDIESMDDFVDHAEGEFADLVEREIQRFRLGVCFAGGIVPQPQFRVRFDKLSDPHPLLPSLISVSVVDAKTGDKGHPASMRLIDENIQRLNASIEQPKEPPMLWPAGRIRTDPTASIRSTLAKRFPGQTNRRRCRPAYRPIGAGLFRKQDRASDSVRYSKDR